MNEAITLRQLNDRIAAIVASNAISGVWVTAETSDLRVSRGHCYTELIQKDPDTGEVLARLRAAIWAQQYQRLDYKFYQATGAHLASDMKVMLKLSVNFHPVYGLSAVVSDIEPGYTIGDLLQRRAQLLARLRAEGVADINRSLPWPDIALRIAVISAHGAAGYGDFIHQLYNNGNLLNFKCELFTATLQGAGAPASVIGALDAVAERIDDFDCVVIIRGGGAVSDLASFDDYELALNVAQYPLPVIVGIGHERDVTILDYVANMRVKTPTAAAEWLIQHNDRALNRVREMALQITRLAEQRIGAERERLTRALTLIPQLVHGNIDRQTMRLEAWSELLKAISPEATLRRGYSVTRIEGSDHALTDSDGIAPGTRIVTTLHNGKITSTTI